MANAIDSYDDLVTAVKEALEDDSTELSSFLPVAINNAELRLTQEVDALGKVAYTTVAASATNPLVSKPDRFRVPRALYYRNSNGKRFVLRKKTNDFINVYWPIRTSVGQPKYYADWDDSTFIVAPTPQGGGNSFIIESENRPSPLSASNQTNTFTSYCPDALFFATMSEVAGTYARNYELRDSYEQKYINTRDALNNEGRRRRRDDGQAVNNPEMGQNTLGPTGSK